MFARLRRHFGRVDVDGEESRVKQTKPKGNDGHRTWSCGMWKAYRQTSSPETVLNKVQANEEEERLNRELELTTKERNELTDRLLYVTGGSMNKSPYFRPNPFYEKLKIKEKKVMSLLHNLDTNNIQYREKF
nr:disks large homolog 5-like isoform X2 [Rattus norvegicus]XP_038954114.1 disks large homolog 5-like isoform X2 [Rattus norvegicus]